MSRRATGRSRRFQVRASGYAAADPRAYGTPIWWHDPAVTASLTIDGSNRVNSMLDLSAAGTDMANAGAVGTWPTYVASDASGNNQPCLQFINQTINRSLASPLFTTDWTIVLVVRNVSASTTTCNILRHGHVANNTGLDYTAATRTRTLTRKGIVIGTDANMTDNTYEVVVIQRANGAAPTLDINSANQALTNSATLTYSSGANVLDYGMTANTFRLGFSTAYAAVVDVAGLVTALRARWNI